MKKYNIILSALVAAVGMLMSACSDEKDRVEPFGSRDSEQSERILV